MAKRKLTDAQERLRKVGEAARGKPSRGFGGSEAFNKKPDHHAQFQADLSRIKMMGHDHPPLVGNKNETSADRAAQLNAARLAHPTNMTVAGKQPQGDIGDVGPGRLEAFNASRSKQGLKPVTSEEFADRMHKREIAHRRDNGHPGNLGHDVSGEKRNKKGEWTR